MTLRWRCSVLRPALSLLSTGCLALSPRTHLFYHPKPVSSSLLFNRTCCSCLLAHIHHPDLEIVRSRGSCNDNNDNNNAMANHLQLPLQEIAVEKRHMPSFLRCILHTILFHRSVKSTTPREETIEELGVSYLRCDDQELYDLVEGRIAALELNPAKRTVIVRINERKQPSWFSKGELKVFEEWIIQYRFTPNSVSEAERGTLECSPRPAAQPQRHSVVSNAKDGRAMPCRAMPVDARFSLYE